MKSTANIGLSIAFEILLAEDSNKCINSAKSSGTFNEKPLHGTIRSLSALNFFSRGCVTGDFPGLA